MAGLYCAAASYYRAGFTEERTGWMARNANPTQGLGKKPCFAPFVVARDPTAQHEAPPDISKGRQRPPPAPAREMKDAPPNGWPEQEKSR